MESKIDLTTPIPPVSKHLLKILVKNIEGTSTPIKHVENIPVANLEAALQAWKKGKIKTEDLRVLTQAAPRTVFQKVLQSPNRDDTTKTLHTLIRVNGFFVDGHDVKADGIFYNVARFSRELLFAFLERGADPNITHEDGTPILFQTLHSSANMELLLEYGADPKIRHPSGHSLLHCIQLRSTLYVLYLFMDNDDFLPMLWDEKGPVNAQDYKHDLTPIQSFVVDKKWDVLKMALDVSIDAGARSGNIWRWIIKTDFLSFVRKACESGTLSKIVDMLPMVTSNLREASQDNKNIILYDKIKMSKGLPVGNCLKACLWKLKALGVTPDNLSADDPDFQDFLDGATPEESIQRGVESLRVAFKFM